MRREVMQQVLKTLKRAQENFEDSWVDAIAVIEAELAKPEQEPVLFIHPSTLEMASAHVGAWKPGHELPGYIALYTSPPQRQPLTNARIDELWCEYPSDEFGFARALEAAHEIKEKIE